MVSISDRLREERERLGLSQAQLADTVGQARKSQIRYESGERSPDGDYLSAVAARGVDVLYVLTGVRSGARMLPGGGMEVGDAAAAFLRQRLQVETPSFAEEPEQFSSEEDTGEDSPPSSVAKLNEFTAIPVYDANLAAGDGADNNVEAIIDHLAFRRDWLRSLDLSPSAAVIARAWGESMAPTLQHGDVVLIDRAKAAPPAKVRAPGDVRLAPIYALLDDGRARVKRLELASPGTLMLLSDNPAVAPEVRPTEAVSIIGRVVWWGHTNRE